MCEPKRMVCDVVIQWRHYYDHSPRSHAELYLVPADISKNLK